MIPPCPLVDKNTALPKSARRRCGTEIDRFGSILGMSSKSLKIQRTQMRFVLLRDLAPLTLPLALHVRKKTSLILFGLCLRRQGWKESVLGGMNRMLGSLTYTIYSRKQQKPGIDRIL